ncbi:MAG: fliP, partial [Alphaproteobacteria bacterium]|nr:fliP [Alphaproteobacteria bacterium]
MTKFLKALYDKKWQFLLFAVALVGIFAFFHHDALAQKLTLDLGGEGTSTGDEAAGGTGTVTGRVVQIVALMTVLSLAPSILMMMTSFTRIVIVFSFLRSA